MTANTHGGPRPQVRDDDARGKHHSPKPGSGRTPSKVTLKPADVFWVSRSDKDGRGVGLSEAWEVTEVTRTHIVFASSDGDRVRLLRVR